MRRALLVLALLCSSGVAHAQFVSEGDKLSQPAGQNVEETKLIGRLYATFGYYGESASEGNGQDASNDTLLWGDLRGRVQADHISGGAWDVLGDFRLRFTPSGDYVRQVGVPREDQVTARGWAGGREYDLRELFVRRSGAKVSFSLGRLVLRDLDAMTIDGASFGVRSSPAFEYGAGVGLFPNPYSRSLDTDYKFAADDERSVTGFPVGAGAWGGYRMSAFYGSVGVGAILPRNTSDTFKEDVRTFLTANGYARVSPTVNVFHYGVFDFTGAAGAQLTSLQLIANWMVTAPLRIELGYSHMSTYAIETYVRNYLEAVTAPAPSLTNNLDVARMAADEGRLGANYAFLEQRLDVFGQVRFRRRDAIATALLDPTIDALPAETQIDVSAGARKKDVIAGWELGGNAAYISGDRTKSLYAFLRGHNAFLEDRLEVDVDLGYVSYEDACAMDSPTCGASKGSTIRAGGSAFFRQSEHWLYIADLHLGYNSGDVAGVARSSIFEKTVMLRAQYSF